MKKKVGVMTFHAAHNYGSSLQAYALKKVINDLGLKCEIINFRTEKQKDQYAPLTRRKGIKYVIKNVYFLLNYKKRKKKYERFEEFINKYLIHNQLEYTSLEMLYEQQPEYDFYVSGSDQVWNPVPRDADKAYFLPFVKRGKKIAYAPSFGKFQKLNIEESIEAYIRDYDFISAREYSGKKIIENITGTFVPVMPDPTLLLSENEWNFLVQELTIKEDYLFFYTLFASPQTIKNVKTISDALNLKVVVSNITNQYDIFSGFQKETHAGPCEFLGLIKRAKFVCVTSFHGTVFSIIFKKPFFVLKESEDQRIETLLKLVGMEDRLVSREDILDKISNAYNIDYEKAHKEIENVKKDAIIFLNKAFEMEEHNNGNM